MSVMNDLNKNGKWVARTTDFAVRGLTPFSKSVRQTRATRVCARPRLSTLNSQLLTLNSRLSPHKNRDRAAVCGLCT